MTGFREAMRAIADDAADHWTPGARLLSVDVHDHDDEPGRTMVTVEMTNHALFAKSWPTAESCMTREEAEIAMALAATVALGIRGAVEKADGARSRTGAKFSAP